jgi:hypothetical protein
LETHTLLSRTSRKKSVEQIQEWIERGSPNESQ